MEILAILDGWWCPAEEIVDDPKVNYLHYSESKGMRNAINMGVALAKGEYILKVDAHVSFAEGFDTTLIADHQDKWIQVPSRYPLDPVKWEKEARTDNKYPIEYEYLDPIDLHGIEWREKRDERKDVLIDEIISAQGSCWFTTKKFFESLGGLDEENYGTFFLEFQELSFKAWTSGGKVMVNKNTSYCHYHKVGSRGYSLNDGEREKAVKYMQTWKDNPEFIKILERFKDMPNWTKNESI